MLKFHAATVSTNDNGEMEYTETKPIWLAKHMIIGFDDHEVYVPNKKLTVMETAEQIQKMFRGDENED